MEFTCGDSALSLSPLKGNIDPSGSDYTVGKVKVEIRLKKANEGRWGKLVKESEDEGEHLKPVLLYTVLLHRGPENSINPLFDHEIRSF